MLVNVGTEASRLTPAYSRPAWVGTERKSHISDQRSPSKTTANGCTCGLGFSQGFVTDRGSRQALSAFHPRSLSTTSAPRVITSHTAPSANIFKMSTSAALVGVIGPRPGARPPLPPAYRLSTRSWLRGSLRLERCRLANAHAEEGQRTRRGLCLILRIHPGSSATVLIPAAAGRLNHTGSPPTC